MRIARGELPTRGPSVTTDGGIQAEPNHLVMCDGRVHVTCEAKPGRPTGQEKPELIWLRLGGVGVARIGRC